VRGNKLLIPVEIDFARRVHQHIVASSSAAVLGLSGRHVCSPWGAAPEHFWRARIVCLVLSASQQPGGLTRVSASLEVPAIRVSLPLFDVSLSLLLDMWLDLEWKTCI